MTWPYRDGYRRIADDAVGSVTPRAEIERIYRELRKNREDVGDRVDSHEWYVSEMETGRLAAGRGSLKWIARTFYRSISNYGLSVLRPVIVLALAIAVGWLASATANLMLCEDGAKAVGCEGLTMLRTASALLRLETCPQASC